MGVRKNMDQKIYTPFEASQASQLRAGDFVLISGTIYTARDAAHKRLYESLKENRPIPIDLANNIFYYMGPTPPREGRAIGSAGPTTSGRMDKYTPLLLDLGLKGMIGKGKRSAAVKASIVKNKSVYFAAIGGLGALLSQRIVKAKVIAYEDLGTEAIRELTVENFPVIVIIDSLGNDLYEQVETQRQVDR